MRLTIFLAVAVVLAGCAGNGGTDTTTPTATTKTTVSGSPVVSSTPSSTTPATSMTPTSPAVIVTPTPTPTPPTTPQLTGTRIIEIIEYNYTPADLVVAKGTIVHIENRHVLSHTLTADNAAFDTGNIKQLEDFDLPMTNLGTFSYYCKNHPQMRGNITVIEAPAEPTPTTPTTPATNESKQTATIFDFDFRPRSPTWNVSTEVTWTNTGSRTHTVTADDGSFDSGDIEPNGKFTATFVQKGEFTYHCKRHTSMRGTITIA